MVRELRRDGPPDLQAVLDALDDPDCRTIIRHLDEPRSAQELAEVTDIPQSTVYRKLETLSEATLVDQRTEIRSDGHHVSRYVLDVDAVTLSLDEDREFQVEVSRPARSPDEQLARMWEEVRKET